jgi:hypothetical protein
MMIIPDGKWLTDNEWEHLSSESRHKLQYEVGLLVIRAERAESELAKVREQNRELGLELSVMVQSMVGDILDKSTKNFAGQIKLIASKLLPSAPKEEE